MNFFKVRVLAANSPEVGCIRHEYLQDNIICVLVVDTDRGTDHNIKFL